MAMTVRFSPELDARLQAIADARHTSKHAIVLQAVEGFVETTTKTERVLESIVETSRDYSETIRRLEDS